MSSRARDAVRRAARAAAIAAVAGVLLYFNPNADGPLLLLGMLVNGLMWAGVTFATVFIFRIIRPGPSVDPPRRPTEPS
jgi:hypothetical protein